MGRLNLARSSFLRWYHPTRLQIGINCLQPFGYGYPYTNGGADTVVMPDARITGQKNDGFDFQRLCLDPETLLFADSASNTVTTVLDARIAEYIAGIARRTALGQSVMVDLHFHGSLVTVQSGWQYADVFDGGTKATRTGFVLARLGAAIHAAIRSGCSPGKVCLEIFNEPPSPSLVTTAAYIAQIKVWWAQVRAAMPLHTIVVGGNNLNAIDGTPAGVASGLTSLTASDFDANTAFSIHNYEAPVFTHQALASTDYQYAHGLKFPATDNVSEQAVKDAFTTAAGGDTNAINNVVTQDGWFSSIHQFYLNYGSKAALATYLGVATAWIDAAGLSRKYLMNTEFGVNFGGATDADLTSAANYVTAIRENGAAAGMNCIVIHEMQGSDFAIQDTSTPWALNSSIRPALFP